jgi:hypothetical protein
MLKASQTLNTRISSGGSRISIWGLNNEGLVLKLKINGEFEAKLQQFKGKNQA